jgi:AraC family transcriptional regulator
VADDGDEGWSWLLPVLVHVQANLDRDLSLARLAEVAGRSAWHVHRQFTARIGETPAAYVARLRLEAAAFQLVHHEATVLEIALACGYPSPDTFTRAFRRRFGTPPSGWRTAARSRRLPRAEPLAPSEFTLSSTRTVRLRPMHLAFLRHVGPYGEVPEALFDTLELWARSRRIAGERVWVGLGHDDPSTTAPDRLRFDAALEVPGPFRPAGGVGYQRFAGGSYAVTTHVGPFGTLGHAYAIVGERLRASREHRPSGGPTLERYRSTRVTARLALDRTDLCVAVTGRADRRVG